MGSSHKSNKTNLNFIDYNNENIKNSYFQTIKKIRRKFYLKNEANKNNILISFENKTFDTIINENIDFEIGNGNLKYIHWMDYFYDYLYNLQDKNIKWAKNLIDLLEDEYFLSENKYLSMFFFQEFGIKTEPNCIKSLYTNNLIDRKSLGSKLGFSSELNITKNLGGSFESIDINLYLPNSPEIQYKNSRTKVKEYIFIFKEHISKDDHPINIIARQFSKVFSKEVNDTINNIKNSYFYKDDKDLVNIINDETNNFTYQLQTFIIKMQIVLKLMYCKTLDYSCFKDEKDELINIMTSLIFRIGNIYQVMYELYSLFLKPSLQNLEYKFEKLKDIKPEDLGIDKQFCLNNTTLNYQLELINKLSSQILFSKSKNEFVKNLDIKSINKDRLKKIKETINQKLKNSPLTLKTIPNKKETENDNSEFFFLEKEDNIIDEINRHIGSIFPEENKSLNKSINSLNDSLINKSLNLYDDEKNKNSKSSKHNFINPQKENFSKLKEKKPKDTIYSPYTSCMSLLKSLKKYKSPFEKIMIIASLSDEIEDCIHEFWEDLTEYVDKFVLGIEGAQLMKIFVYIIIKTKMTDIIVFCKIISLFTSCTTKSSTIGYYYSSFEYSISYIIDTNIENIISNKSIIKSIEDEKDCNISTNSKKKI